MTDAEKVRFSGLDMQRAVDVGRKLMEAEHYLETAWRHAYSEMYLREAKRALRQAVREIDFIELSFRDRK